MAIQLRHAINLRPAHTAFNAVFASDDPFEFPVADTAPHRLLGWQIGYELTSDQLEKLANCWKRNGLSSDVYVFELESPRRVWRTSFEESLYESLLPEGWSGGVSWAIVDLDGRAGLMGSFEWHGICAGPESFLHCLQSEMEEFRLESVRAMLASWREESRDMPDEPLRWLRDLLEHIYGAQIGNELFRSAGFR